jgi:hypothetical protein
VPDIATYTPSTDHRYSAKPGQYICEHCGRVWSSHAYQPAAVLAVAV